MSLEVQIQTVVVAILYGVYLGIFIDLYYYYIRRLKKIFRNIILVLFFVFNTLGYFYIVFSVNMGIFHIYLLLFNVIGYILYYKFYHPIMLKINRKK